MDLKFLSCELSKYENWMCVKDPFSQIQSHIDRVDSIDCIDRVDSIDRVDNIDSIDSIDSIDRVDSIDKVDCTDIFHILFSVMDFSYSVYYSVSWNMYCL